MDIFLNDPDDIPVPREEVRVRQLQAEPWPDNRRVRIRLEITPFLERPNGEIKIFDPGGEEVASLAIVETIAARMEFTMHLRGELRSGEYTAAAAVYYAGPDESAAGEGSGPRDLPPPTKIQVVDRAETRFAVRADERADPEGEG